MFVRPRTTFGTFARKGLAAALPFALGLILAFAPEPAAARRHHHGGAAVGLTDPRKDAALILDGETGKILYARNATITRYPASLTKLMTLYMLFDAMQKGQMTLQTPMAVSAHAANQSPVKLHLTPGDTITIGCSYGPRPHVMVPVAPDARVCVAKIKQTGGAVPYLPLSITCK